MMTENSSNSNDLKKEVLREAYVSRINRVIDYINKNIDRELSLETLAGVADFSPFHFHRVFRAMMGETLSQFIQQVRVEKAASQLISHPRKPITDVAFDCGFSGSSAFSRTFRETFRMSPSQWRSGKKFKDSKIGKIYHNEREILGKIGKDFHVSVQYNFSGNPNVTWEVKMTDKKKIHVEVTEMPEMVVAYVRPCALMGR